MDKAFNLSPCLPVYLLYLLQGKLSGRHNPGRSHSADQGRSRRSRHCHLGAGVNVQIRKMPFYKGEYSHILDNHRVQPLLVVREQIAVKLLHLPLLYQGIHCHINSAAMEVGIINGLLHPVLVQIVCIGPGAEFIPADIDGVRSSRHSRLHALKGSGWRQNLRASFHRGLPPFLLFLFSVLAVHFHPSHFTFKRLMRVTHISLSPLFHYPSKEF